MKLAARRRCIAGGRLHRRFKSRHLGGTVDRAREYGLGAETLVEDIDGDGRMDVVTGQDTGSGKVVVWFGQTAAGTWQRHVLIATAYCHDLAFGDLDGNGALDGVCIDQEHSRVFRLTPGASAAALWTSSVIDTMDVMGVGNGDIDRDGRPDVVAGRGWYRNTGSGWVRYAFTTLRTTGNYTGPDFSNYSYLSLRDLNGDGRLDIFATLFAESPEGKVTPSSPRPTRRRSCGHGAGRRGTAVRRAHPTGDRLRCLRSSPGARRRVELRRLGLRPEPRPADPPRPARRQPRPPGRLGAQPRRHDGDS